MLIICAARGVNVLGQSYRRPIREAPATLDSIAPTVQNSERSCLRPERRSSQHIRSLLARGLRLQKRILLSHMATA